MEYSERSFVEGGFDRKLTFPDVKWLSKAKFEAVLKEGSVSIQPCLNSCYEEHDEPICDSRMYVGKSIPKQPPDIDENHNIRTSLGDIRLASFHYLELIGNVLLREDYIDEPETNRRRRKSTWVLRITHNGHTHDIEDDFLVLHIADARTYFWSPSYDTNTLPNGQVITFPKNAVPNFAFRAAFNRLDHKYNYIGRMLTNSKTNSSGSDQQQIQPLCNQRLKFYANAWVSFEDGSNNSGVKYSFGRIGRSQRLLFVPYRNIEVGLDCFETLCLKASPASLKTLCRSIVRANLNKSQECIKSLEPSIPRTLLDFIKYPVNLKLGEFLLRGEKLVAEDGRSEMWIDEANDELILKDTEGRLITLGRGFDIVCVHKFHLIFYDLMNSRVFQSHAFYDANRFYRFTGEWNKQSWKIEL